MSVDYEQPRRGDEGRSVCIHVFVRQKDRQYVTVHVCTCVSIRVDIFLQYVQLNSIRDNLVYLLYSFVILVSVFTHLLQWCNDQYYVVQHNILSSRHV